MHIIIKLSHPQVPDSNHLFKLTKALLSRNGFLLSLFLSILSYQGNSQTVRIDVSSLNDNFCAPALIKLTPIFSTPPNDLIWEFGIITDEDERSFSPTINFLLPGTYNVRLTAVFQNSLITVVESITIYGVPVLTVIPDRNYLCQPGGITFSAQSPLPISTYTWDFKDGSAETSQPSGIITHSFTAFGDFNVDVTATTAKGCSTKQSIPVYIKKPAATLTGLPKNGCLPANVLLQANVIVPAGSTVVNYNWNFGDGTPT